LPRALRQEPYEVAVGGETQYICACGLSATLPFCDGTHAITKDEDPARLVWYDEDLERHEAADTYPDIRSDRQTLPQS
jgi:CDGSH-type Zn-finger protein